MKNAPLGAGRALAFALALLPTPLLVLVTSSRQLYERNAKELYGDPSVLAPFLAAALLAVAAGALLVVSRRRRVPRALLALYLAAAPAFLVLQLARRGGELGGGGTAAVLLVLGGTAAWLGRAGRLDRAAGPWALFGAALLALELVAFVRMPKVAPAAPIADAVPPAAASGLPNVYHLVLDGFQTELFSAVATPELRERLAGFVLYRRNTAAYHLTAFSLASVFAGRRYAYDAPRPRYLRDAFLGEESLLARLRRKGYGTIAFVPGLRELDLGGFDAIVDHAALARDVVRRLHRSAFRRLWWSSTWPASWIAAAADRGWLSGLSRAEMERLRNGRLLLPSAPAVSAWSFRRLVEREAELPARGRYTFVHLLLPHTPFVLREDCSLPEDGRPTDFVRQGRCALELVAAFVDELRRLGRLDDALVVVHGDHGEPFHFDGGALFPRRARSLRALLLVKPAGRTPATPLIVSDAPASLLDLAPTILAAVGEPPSGGWEGRVLPVPDQGDEGS